MPTNDPNKREYALGHSNHEIGRLERQGDYFHDLTRDLFVRAGLHQGMRVLDYGSGAGDVAILAAEVVGTSGTVTSFDRSAEAVSRASSRAAERGLDNVRFLQADEETLREFIGTERFDAVVGRLVLVFQNDPAAALRTVMSYAHPGGIVAFHEYDQEGGCWSHPRLPLFEELSFWVIETFRRGGMVTDAGKVSRTFHDAGVESARVVREGQVADRTDPLAHRFLVDTMRTMLPLAEKRGVTTAAEVQIDTLLDRLNAESDGTQVRWIPAFLVAAWGRVPTPTSR
jgi:ubiquinone/menaquinone biosynthesis C-methylase UbiE